MREAREMLRDYRERRGMTQKFVAKAAGIKPGRLSALENGAIRLTADDFLHILVEGFKTTPCIFFEEQLPEIENEKLKLQTFSP